MVKSLETDLIMPFSFSILISPVIFLSPGKSSNSLTSIFRSLALSLIFGLSSSRVFCHLSFKSSISPVADSALIMILDSSFSDRNWFDISLTEARSNLSTIIVSLLT